METFKVGGIQKFQKNLQQICENLKGFLIFGGGRGRGWSQGLEPPPRPIPPLRSCRGGRSIKFQDVKIGETHLLKKNKNWSELKGHELKFRCYRKSIKRLSLVSFDELTMEFIQLYQCAMKFVKNYLSGLPPLYIQMFLISMMTKITLMKCFNCSGSRLM